jgi:hypothetical protein
MTRTHPVIRLVGGPRPLDGSSFDPATSTHARADLDGDRFHRAVRGTTAASLAELRERCTDRASTEQLAADWGCAVFTYGRDRRLRTRYYRYQATYRLRPARDGDGGWTLEVTETALGPATVAGLGAGPGAAVGLGVEAAAGAGGGAVRDAARSAAGSGPAAEVGRAVWALLEEAVDEASGRFATVAGLLPDGPLGERAHATRRAVSSCVHDAARLCAVGTAIAPAWRPDGRTGDDDRDGRRRARDDHRDEDGRDDGRGDERATRLAGRVASLVGTIEAATAHLVDLHLELGDDADPIAPVEHLRDAWLALADPA